jgi:hypothetical protein
MWKCPTCQQAFGVPDRRHHCPGIEPYSIGGVRPDGGPGEHNAPALPEALPRREALKRAMELTMTITGPHDGHSPAIDARAFDAAILVYRPREKFNAYPDDLDRADYAGRAALRILNQSFGTRDGVPGRFSRHSDRKKIGMALHARILELASRGGVDPYTGRELDRSP